MSAPAKRVIGRFADEDPYDNLRDIDDDSKEFERFDDDGAPPGPRTTAPGYDVLSVEHVDMCQQMNKPKHYTTDYEIPNLVVRRGHEFIVKVTFNRLLVDGDDFQLEFLIGPNPSPNKGSLVVVPFGSRGGSGPWRGHIVDASGGTTIVLGITPSPNAIVGKFRTYVAIATAAGMQRTKRDTSTDLYVLFNAWCTEDPVFLPNESERIEYVLNDVGVIFQGSVGHVGQRSWIYGQFEKGILDACIFILDSSRMPIFNRGNVIKLVRKGSAMINSQDDNGVLVGNWGNDFSMGTPPTAWMGSVKILLKYAHTGVPVNYAQCWVYAGVFNTFLRCLGIPARVITNFSSAHDNTGNLKTDLIFKMDGTPDRRNTRDSIWNYHCWNEVWMTRPDLPPNLSGFQVVDSTPQETSDGHFRCGPASVNAIKDGLLCHPFDAGFVFAEVNSDVVFLKRDRYGTLTPFKVDTTHVGQALYTKAVGSYAPMDVTHTYKYAEGSPQDELSMQTAEGFGCERDHSDVPAGEVTVQISAEPCMLGSDVHLQVVFSNQSSVVREVVAHVEATIIFYTGVTAEFIKKEDFVITVQPYDHVMQPLVIKAEEYMKYPMNERTLHIMLTGQSLNQSLNDSLVVDPVAPPLHVEVVGTPQVGREMLVTVRFTNRFHFDLHNVYVKLEGAGLTLDRTGYYEIIYSGQDIEWKQKITPQRAGPRRLIAGLDTASISHIQSELEIMVAPAGH